MDIDNDADKARVALQLSACPKGFIFADDYFIQVKHICHIAPKGVGCVLHMANGDTIGIENVAATKVASVIRDSPR